MRLGVNLGYWGRDVGPGATELAVRADQLGYRVCFAAEAYGSDAATVLSFVAARTEQIELCSAAFQLPARSAAMTAMTAATLDALSGGRFRLGVGVSGPQVVEGWHGVRYTDPLNQTREYLDVLRLALAGERVEYTGVHLRLPLPNGPGKALKLGFRPVRPEIPISVASIGPRNLHLTGEIADGWIGLFFSPDQPGLSLDPIIRGRLAGGADPADPLAGFDTCVLVPVAVDEDPDRAADTLRAHYALYLGGMGSRTRNFYHRLATRLGYGPQADEVQRLFLAGQPRDAAAAVPVDLIDETALIGPLPRIAGRLQRFRAAGITTLGLGFADTATSSAEDQLAGLVEIVDPGTSRGR